MPRFLAIVKSRCTLGNTVANKKRYCRLHVNHRVALWGQILPDLGNIMLRRVFRTDEGWIIEANESRARAITDIETKPWGSAVYLWHLAVFSRRTRKGDRSDEMTARKGWMWKCLCIQIAWVERWLRALTCRRNKPLEMQYTCCFRKPALAWRFQLDRILGESWGLKVREAVLDRIRSSRLCSRRCAEV